MEPFQIGLTYEKPDDSFPSVTTVFFRPVIGDGIRLVCDDGKERRFRVIDFDILADVGYPPYAASAKLAEWGDD